MGKPRIAKSDPLLLSARDLEDGLQILSALLAQDGGGPVDLKLIGSGASTLLGFAQGAADFDFYSPTPGGHERVMALESDVRAHMRYHRQLREATSGLMSRILQPRAEHREIIFEENPHGRSKEFAVRHGMKYFHPVAFRNPDVPQGLNLFLPTPEALLLLRLGDSRAPRKRDLREMWVLAKDIGFGTKNYEEFRDQIRDFWSAHRDDVPNAPAEVGYKIRKVWEEFGTSESQPGRAFNPFRWMRAQAKSDARL